MKQILFVVTYLDTGGISRSLQNLLSKLDVESYKVDVFAMAHQGVFQNSLPNCRLLPKDYLMNALISRTGKEVGIRKVELLCVKLLNRLTGGRLSNWIYRNVSTKLSRREKYDAIIAYSEGVPTKLVSLIEHQNKVAWIHCDYKSYYDLNEKSDESSTYESFRSIVNVSEYTRKSFVNIYPHLAERTWVINNVLDSEMMKEQANAVIDYQFPPDTFNIVSIGRLDPIKRLSVIPQIAAALLSAGCRFKWYVVGPKGGNDDEYIKLCEGIREYQLESNVIMTGEQKNPYPFIKSADLLVNTSISEACPYVINEAKILHTPVICTNFGSAREFIANGLDGFIVNVDNIHKKIIELILDTDEYNEIKKHLESFTYRNEDIIASFNQLMQ